MASISLVLLSILLILFSSSLAQPNTPEYNGGKSHRAHAVPGGPYIFFDHSGSGHAIAVLSAAASHTHYFNPSTGATGHITSYSWRYNGNEVCTTSTCRLNLPVSRTRHRVRLFVTDSTGDVANGTARVAVRDGGRQGYRMLIYKDVPNAPVFSTRVVKPTLSRTLHKQINLWNVNYFPFSPFVRDHVFGTSRSNYSKAVSIRLELELDISEAGPYSLRLQCGGAACFAQIDSKGVLFPLRSGAQSRVLNLQQRAYKLSVVFRRAADTVAPPRLVLQWIPAGATDRSRHVNVPAGAIAYRPGNVVPVVHYVRPRRAAVDSTLRVHGSSLVAPVVIFVGRRRCLDVRVINQYAATCELSGVSPSDNQTVSVRTTAGTSNTNVLLDVTPRDIAAAPGYSQPVAWRRSSLVDDKNDPFAVSSITAITLGPDGRFYFATQWGVVLSAIINRDVVYDVCAAPRVRDRAILDVAFNPATPGSSTLYATLSTLKWGSSKYADSIAYEDGWHNGEIATYVAVPGARPGCMKYDKPLITGLPVSNYDHGVSKLAFDDSGNLYVSVGTNTNAGVPSPQFGSLPDTLLSGTVLRFPVLSRAFDGAVKYDRYDRPDVAKVVSGDVEVYATGLRNSFGLAYTFTGRLYATDNGANARYGRKSTTCTTDAPSGRELDKLVLVQQGKWYGAANRVTGKCTHRSPGNKRDEAENDWTQPLETLPSATTGIIEYRPNTFGGTLRGNLLLSQLSTKEFEGRLSRVQLNTGNGSVDKLFSIHDYSGLAIAVGPTGDVIMPKVFNASIAVVMAREKNPGIIVVTSVNPNRGPISGGYELIVTGWNFKGHTTGMKVTVGGAACENITKIGRGRMTNRILRCIVPQAQRQNEGAKSVPVIVTDGTATSLSSGDEFRYMAV